MDGVVVEVVEFESMGEAPGEAARCATDVGTRVLLVGESIQMAHGGGEHLHAEDEVLDVGCFIGALYQARFGGEEDQDALKGVEEDDGQVREASENDGRFLKADPSIPRKMRTAGAPREEEVPASR